MNSVKLLYVEDDIDYAELICKRLRNEDFEIVIVPTAAKAEKLFREFRPELVMVDLDLQYEKEGLDFIRNLHRQFPWFPIVVYSAHVEPETIIETMNFGVLHHIGKDRSVPELTAMLRNALRQAYHCKEQQNSEYQLSPLTTFKIATQTLLIAGKPINLNRTISLLLRQLCLHINEFVPPNELSKAIWGIVKEPYELRRYISKLRKIIEPLDPNIHLLNQTGGYYQLECLQWKEEIH